VQTSEEDKKYRIQKFRFEVYRHVFENIKFKLKSSLHRIKFIYENSNKVMLVFSFKLNSSDFLLQLGIWRVVVHKVKNYKRNIIKMMHECYFFLVFIIRYAGGVDWRIFLRWCEGVDWTKLAQSRVQWRALVNTVMHFRFHKIREISWLAELRSSSHEGPCFWSYEHIPNGE
jgi:hypothetical protein